MPKKNDVSGYKQKKNLSGIVIVVIVVANVFATKKTY